MDSIEKNAGRQAPEQFEWFRGRNLSDGGTEYGRVRPDLDLLLAAPVFDGLLGHGGTHNDHQRQQDAHSPVRRQRGEGDARHHEEEHVGHPPELLEQ